MKRNAKLGGNQGANGTLSGRRDEKWNGEVDASGMKCVEQNANVTLSGKRSEAQSGRRGEAWNGTMDGA